jgi:hypothetical protein
VFSHRDGFSKIRVRAAPLENPAYLFDWAHVRALRDRSRRSSAVWQ